MDAAVAPVYVVLTQASTVSGKALSEGVWLMVIKSLEPSKSIALAGDALAVMAKLKVGFVQSLLYIFKIALLVPNEVGVKLTTKVLETPVVRSVLGIVVIEKLEALVPLKSPPFKYKVPVPMF